MILNLLHLSIFVNKNKFMINVFIRDTYSVCINYVKEKNRNDVKEKKP